MVLFLASVATKEILKGECGLILTAVLSLWDIRHLGLLLVGQVIVLPALFGAHFTLCNGNYGKICVLDLEQVAIYIAEHCVSGNKMVASLDPPF